MATNQLGCTESSYTSSYGDSDQAMIVLTVGGTDSITAPESGTCTKMFVYVTDAGAGSNTVIAGIYDDSAGSPNDLIGSGSFTGTLSTGWNEITITSTTITSGDDYYPVVLGRAGDARYGTYNITGYSGNRDLSVTSLPDPWVGQLATAYAPQVYLEYDGSASGITLEADASSYAITGADVAVELDRTLSTETTAFTIIGTDIEILHDYIVPSETGSFTVTGSDVELNIVSDKTISAESGSYSVSGNSVDITKTSIIQTDSGVYTVTGSDVDITIVADRIIVAETGSYGISGNDVSILKDSTISADSALYAITGSNVNITWSGALTDIYYNEVEINGIIKTKATITGTIKTSSTITGNIKTSENILGEIG